MHLKLSHYVLHNTQNIDFNFQFLHCSVSSILRVQFFIIASMTSSIVSLSWVLFILR